jgi:photosystem II stability/assembly factor-like uncharacterized protein
MVILGIYKFVDFGYFYTRKIKNNASLIPINLITQNMYTFTYFKILVFSFFMCSFSAFSSDLSSVKFMNQNSGYISGSNGTLLKTTDCGNTWITIPSPVQTNIMDFVILGETSLMIIADSSVYYSSDDGQNWELRMEGLSGTFNSIIFTYDAKLFICGNNSAFFVSNDFGNYWEQIEIPILSHLKKLYFLDQNWGYLVGSNGLIMTSSDGGNSWVMKNNAIGTQRLSFNSIAMSDDKTGIIVGDNGCILRTTNGWNFVKTIISPSGTADLYDVKFISPETALISGNKIILKSTSSGGEWEPASFSSSLPRNEYRSICFPTSQTGFTVGTNNTILITNNFGTSWASIFPSINESIVSESSNLNNFPNPFNPSTTISFNVFADGYVSLKVYDITGRLVSDLINGYKNKGNYSINYNASSLSSGIYFYTLNIKSSNFEYNKTNRMLLVK